jgi:hypothetical protein
MEKIMKKIILVLLVLIMNFYGAKASAEQKIDEIQQYEIKSYDPKTLGLTDLIFEARIENLTDLLNKTLSIGKLVDVHFKIYWISPTQYNVEVVGLKPGFKEIKDDLANLIKGKLEFIIPEKFSEKFKSYTLKTEPLTDGKLIRAIDETYSMAVSEIDIKFEKDGKLKSVVTKAPMSKISTEFFQSPKSWSSNKLVLDKTISTSMQGAAEIIIENAVEYKSFQGIGLPIKITVKNKSIVKIPATEKEKEKVLQQESTSHIYFTKYEINSGKAHKHILEGV